MGNNNIRIRAGAGVGVGDSSGKSKGVLDLSWVGGYFGADVMWLHSILNYSGNLGIGMGLTPIVSSVDEGDNSFTYNGFYYTIPMQFQYVDRSGITFGVLLTPAVAVSQSIKGSDGTKIKDTDMADLFADFRIALGCELGYNYKRFDFGLRYNLWIGNMVAKFSSTIIHEFAFSVGYRIKIN